MDQPRWYQDAIFYELYIRAFRDSNGDGHGDINGVIEKLDYIRDLGVDCIWLLPMYPSPLHDDGYDVADYRNIHEDYGTLEDFKRLIDAAHARGLRVITDLVVNHTSEDHEWFKESRSSLDNPKRDWYVWTTDRDKYSEVRIIFLDTETSNWAYDPISGEHYWHRFFSSQPDLNYDNPEVQEEMLDIMAFWFDLGIDGFRVDAVPYLYEREGTNGENLPETHEYVRKMRKFVDENYPDAVLLAEANQPPDEVVEYFGDGDEFHMAFHFPVMPRIFMSLKHGNATPIRDIMDDTPPIPENAQWCTFLRNHDELTLEMVTEEEREWMWQAYAPRPRMRLNLGIRRRLAPLLDNDPDKIMLANRILFSLPGAPIIYYGDEIGMGDNIDLKDRDGVRTPMQWDDSLNAGFSEADPDELYAPVIDDPVYGHERVNVASQVGDPNSLFNKMRDLIAIRRFYRSLSKGSISFFILENDAILAYLRVFKDERFLILHNLTPVEQPITLHLPQHIEAGTTVTDVLRPNESRSPITDDPYDIILESYASQWLHLHQEGEEA